MCRGNSSDHGVQIYRLGKSELMLAIGASQSRSVSLVKRVTEMTPRLDADQTMRINSAA